LVKRLLMLLVAGVASTCVGVSGALAAPATQSSECPVAGSDLVSSVVGGPAKIFDPEFGVTVNGTNTECLFIAGSKMVLVRRTSEFFADGGASATPEQVDQLRELVVEDVDDTPVSGVGDAALWATVRDRSRAPERKAVLISKRGADAFMVGVMDTPDALTAAITLTQAVLAGQP
jgi:hypothetical protein